MPHQDQSIFAGFSTSTANHKYIFRLLSWLFQGVCWQQTRMRSDCSWTPRTLAAAGILWAWADQHTLGDRFAQTLKIVTKVFHRSTPPVASYQSFIKLLRRHTTTVVPSLIARLRSGMQEQLSSCFLVHGRPVFVVDGSCIELPRTKSNEKAFAKTRKRKPKSSFIGARTEAGKKRNRVPQIYLTLLWNLGTQLPWAWRDGPSNAWECEDLEQMLGELPDHSLIVGDAKFIGYELWTAIFASGHDLLVRVGSNVKLLKKLGFTREYNSTVYYWPNQTRYKQQPPLVFRLLVIQGGKKPVYLLTNLKAGEFSNRTICDIYARRWGIELFYRTFKRTFGRSKLRSGRAENATCELTWSLIGLWSAGLMALMTTDIAPPRLSMALVLRAIRGTLRNYRIHPDPDEDIVTLLCRAEIDEYQRKNRQNRTKIIRDRNYQAKLKPKIANPNKAQIKRAIQLKKELRLTA